MESLEQNWYIQKDYCLLLINAVKEVCLVTTQGVNIGNIETDHNSRSISQDLPLCSSSNNVASSSTQT